MQKKGQDDASLKDQCHKTWGAHHGHVLLQKQVSTHIRYNAHLKIKFGPCVSIKRFFTSVLSDNLKKDQIISNYLKKDIIISNNLKRTPALFIFYENQLWPRVKYGVNLFTLMNYSWLTLLGSQMKWLIRPQWFSRHLSYPLKHKLSHESAVIVQTPYIKTIPMCLLLSDSQIWFYPFTEPTIKWSCGYQWMCGPNSIRGVLYLMWHCIGPSILDL